jgi:hypothetical protein
VSYRAKGTNIYMKKEDAGIVRMEAAQLGFSSPAELINALVALRKEMKWSKLDIEILTVYHRLPEPTVITEEELKKAGYVKASKFTEKGPKIEAPVAQKFEQTIPVEIEVVPKKKQRKQKKKKEPLKMPTSNEFFNGSKKEF